MASAYSVLHNYDTPVFTPNYQLIASAMQYKQGKIDSNRERLQTLYDKLNIVDVAKAGDKDYVENRLQTAKSIANKYASLDLSSNNLTNQLIGKLSDVVDDNVKNAVLSTRVYRSEQKAWDKLREEKPDKYNETNHMYANQGSSKWLNDGKIGSKYNGGGDVVEYRDLSKKIMDNLPKLQKALKAEWITTGPKQGYFRSTDTYEEVPRGKMEQALSVLFDDKDKQQMGINSWGQYDKMDEGQLKEQYDGYFQPRLDYLDKRMTAVDAAIGKAQTKTEKAELRQLKSDLGKARETHMNNSYDNVAGTYGKEAAYRRLYTEKFNNNILDTYSYGRRMTETKVNAVDKANKEYSLKLKADARAERADARAAEKAQFDRDMDISKLELDVAKFNQEFPGVNGSSIVKGKAEAPDTPIARGDEISRAFEEHDQAKSAVVSLFKKNGLTEADLNSKDFISGLSTMVSNGYITVNGKKIEMKGNEHVLQSYKNKVLQNDQAIGAAVETIDDMVKDINNKIGAAAYLADYSGGKAAEKDAGELDFNPDDSIPEFNFRIENGKVIPTKEGDKYAKQLYRQSVAGTLSSDQQLTLDMYSALWSHNAKGIKDVDKRVLERYMAKKLSGLNKGEAEKISFEVGNDAGVNMPNTYGNVNYVYDYNLDEITGGDLSFIRWDNSEGQFSEEDIANIERANAMMTSGNAPSRILGDMTSTINQKISEKLAKTEQMPFKNQAIVVPGSEAHINLRRLIGANELKTEIYISKKMNPQGLPTGENDVTYSILQTSGDNKGSYEPSEVVVISDAELAESRVVAFDTSRYDYDANMGDMAPKINLGNNVYSKLVKDTRIVNGEPEDYLATGGKWSQDVLKLVKEETKSDEAVEVVARAIQDYRSGDFDFKVEAINGVYQINMLDSNGNSVHTYMPKRKDESTFEDISPSEVVQFMSDPRLHIESTFASYIDNLSSDLFTGRADAGELLIENSTRDNPAARWGTSSQSPIRSATEELQNKSYRPGYTGY